METKPYRIQSPEDIAKDYAGNKQKIAQAMQMGIVDPTAGVLAGMFIDRMRSAQMQEMAPQQSVAQQVMGGPSPAPVSPSAGGLGAIAPAMPPMASDMAPPMPEEAPVGMAAGGLYDAPYMSEGGLSELPLPDTMFDEDRNGGYAGGGIVAFANGGMSNLYDSVEYWESRGNQNAVSPKGARGVMQLMPGTMRDPGFGIAPMRSDTEEENRRVGREYLDAMYRKYGDQKLALAAYNWGPGNVDKWLKSGADPAKLPGETRKYISNIMQGTEPPAREADIDTAQGRSMSLDDSVALAQRYMKPGERELAAEEKTRARLEEMASDEYYDKQRKDSMWETLTAIGLNMASSKAPGILQAVSEAAAAALPGAKADKKERKALKDKALEGLMELGARDRQRANEVLKVGTDLFKTGVDIENAEKLMAYRYAALEQDKAEGVLDRAAAERRQQIAATSRDTMFEQLAGTFEAQIRQRIEQGIPIRRASGEGYITFPKGKTPSDAEIRALANEMAIIKLKEARGGGASASGGAAAESVRSITEGRAGGAGADTVNLGEI